MKEKEQLSGEFKNLVDLMAVYSEASNRLEVMQAQANEGQMEVVDALKKEYGEIQDVVVATGAALELLARRHPEWFSKKATLTTPYGSVKLAQNPPSLEVANEELSIALIEQAAERDQTFPREVLVRVEKHLNLDALKTLDDETLKRFRITRKQTDTFTVKPTKLDLGKAVEAAASESKN